MSLEKWFHQFTNSPTHLLTQSPIHQFTPPHLTNHPFLTWLQLYSYSKCPPPSLILIVVKLQIFVHTDDVCGQGTQCDGQHWRQGFENWCESFCRNISIVQTLRVHVPPLSPHSLNHHHCHYNADDGQVRNQQRREQLRGKQDAAEEEDYTTFLQQVLFVILIVMMIVILMVMMMMIINWDTAEEDQPHSSLWSGLVCKMNMMIATLSFPGGGLILNLGSGSLRDAVRQHGGVTYYHIFKFQECWILGLAWYETFIILISSWSTVVIVIVIVTVLPNWHHCHRNRLKALNFLNLMPDKSTHHVPIKSP